MSWVWYGHELTPIKVVRDPIGNIEHRSGRLSPAFYYWCQDSYILSTQIALGLSSTSSRYYQAAHHWRNRQSSELARHPGRTNARRFIHNSPVDWLSYADTAVRNQSSNAVPMQLLGRILSLTASGANLRGVVGNQGAIIGSIWLVSSFSVLSGWSGWIYNC